MQFNCASLASYDVIKAKTVSNENLIEPIEEELTPTFNDYELPEASDENSLVDTLERKIKKI